MENRAARVHLILYLWVPPHWPASWQESGKIAIDEPCLMPFRGNCGLSALLLPVAGPLFAAILKNPRVAISSLIDDYKC